MLDDHGLRREESQLGLRTALCRLDPMLVKRRRAPAYELQGSPQIVRPLQRKECGGVPKILDLPTGTRLSASLHRHRVARFVIFRIVSGRRILWLFLL